MACAGKDNLVFQQHPYLWDDIFPAIRDVDTVVLALGESARISGEDNCLADIGLPKEQLEFAKKIKALGKKIVGVLCFGRPIALGEAEPYFDAILYAWQSGTCAAQSIADIIYGRVNPSGKLPMTFPRVTGQVPIYYNYPSFFGNGQAYYGVGRNYWDCQSTPMYPFGYGLSYTKFEYSKVRCENDTLALAALQNGAKFRVSVTLTNTGSCAGKETAQCYISDLVASMTRQIKELKGFSKVAVKQGESREIAFELGFEKFGFYNASGEFRVEPGEFDVFIGGDCTTDNKVKIVILDNK